MRSDWANITAAPIRSQSLALARAGLSVSVRIMKPSKPTLSKKNCPHHFMNERMRSLVKNVRVLPPLGEGLEKSLLAKVMPVCEVSLLPHRHESLVYFRYSVCITLPLTTKNADTGALRHPSAKIHPCCARKLCHTRLCRNMRESELPKRKNYNAQHKFRF